MLNVTRELLLLCCFKTDQINTLCFGFCSSPPFLEEQESDRYKVGGMQSPACILLRQTRSLRHSSAQLTKFKRGKPTAIAPS
ncbi:MAG: hypothetical protein V7K77_25770 [Nostoc sp.]|uniref:hypothetical protein n=1 Tax=Nostoc sp. TaxID=1180 RepID=UPI002FF4CB23